MRNVMHATAGSPDRASLHNHRVVSRNGCHAFEIGGGCWTEKKHLLNYPAL